METQLPTGVDLTLSELQEMASRQQQQIEAQQQLLVAKEQRLKFLKQQELRHQQIASENERLRKLREKVEAQELKLKKLRALRGQVNEHKGTNSNLSQELETIKALFNEKEKELSLAVAKVEELTKQLEDMRTGRTKPTANNKLSSPTLQELDKLRNELMVRNKLNEQQNSKLAAHREILLQRKDEMAKMDQRIAELQVRLRKKRNVPQQESIYSINNKTSNNNNNKLGGRPLSSANIAAVEPYMKHMPNDVPRDEIEQDKNFLLSKQDPKYQTLPYNIKFPSTSEGKRENDSDSKQHNYNAEKSNADAKSAIPMTSSKTSQPSAVEMLARDTVQNKPDYKPSIGHTIAYEAVDETLKNVTNTDPVRSYFGIGYKPASSLMSNFAPRPYGSTYSTSALNSRPSSILKPAPSISTTASTSSPSLLSSPGLTDFPKTSTPVSKPALSVAEMKEIFITGGPVAPNLRNNSKPPPYSSEQSQSLQPTHPSLASVGSTAPLGPTGQPPLYHVASSRPQPQMQPQRTGGPPSPVTATLATTVVTAPQNTKSSDSRAPNTTVTHTNSRSYLQPNSMATSSQFSNVEASGHHSHSSSNSSETAPVMVLEAGGGYGGWIGRSSSTNTPPMSHPTPHASQAAQQPSPTYSQSSSTNTSGESASGGERGENKPAMDGTVSSALSVLTSAHITTNVNTKPSYRYAPKSVIANTYMRRMGSAAMEQYRQNMNQMYKGLDIFQQPSTDGQKSGDKPPESPTAKVRPMNMESEHPDRSSPPEGEKSSDSEDRSSPPEQLPHLVAPVYDLDVERLHYSRPNAPKGLRRRLSAGESDDMGRLHHLRQQHQREEEERDRYAQQSTNHAFDDNATRRGSSPPEIVHMDVIQDSYNNNYSDDQDTQRNNQSQAVDNSSNSKSRDPPRENLPVALRRKKTNLKAHDAVRSSRRVSFDPLALLLDASLEGELELVMRTAREVPDPSSANDEGITALHNAICAGHFEIVKFLVEYGCNVNAPDSDGWTPLHCAASCNNLAMVKMLVEHGACIFATTISDHETAAEKCEEDEDGYDGCSEYLYSVQEKLGIINNGIVFAVFEYAAQHHDELSFHNGASLVVLRKGDEQEKDWWWARIGDREGYIPRNLLGLYPRVPLGGLAES